MALRGNALKFVVLACAAYIGYAIHNHVDGGDTPLLKKVDSKVLLRPLIQRMK